MPASCVTVRCCPCLYLRYLYSFALCMAQSRSGRQAAQPGRGSPCRTGTAARGRLQGGGTSDHRRMARTRMAGCRCPSWPRQAGPRLDLRRDHPAWLPRRPGGRGPGGERAVRQCRDARPAGGPGARGLLPVVRTARGSSSATAAVPARRGCAGSRARPKAAAACTWSTRSRRGGAASASPGTWSPGVTSASRCALPPATPGPGLPACCPPALICPVPAWQRAGQESGPAGTGTLVPVGATGSGVTVLQPGTRTSPPAAVQDAPAGGRAWPSRSSCSPGRPGHA